MAVQPSIYFASKRDSKPAEAGKVLLLDDDDLCHQKMSLAFNALQSDIELRKSKTVQAALEILNTEKVHALFLDRDLGKDEDGEMINGINFIPTFLEAQPHLQILVLTGTNEIAEVVRAIQLGAQNYILKNTPDQLVIASAQQAIRQSRVKLNEIIQNRSKPNNGIEFIGKSKTTKHLRARLSAVAESDRPVLLLGESGTGKTTAAKFIHELRVKLTGAKELPFVALNMGSIPPSLAERELFGNERGAYTDAKESRPGAIELANGGTLFLDEIGEAPLELQVKLLKVIEDGKFKRLGGQNEKKSSFKLICATNRDLYDMVEKKLFREDLLMRIATFVEKMPSLSKRPDDIEDLVQSMLPKVCAENKVWISYEDLPPEFIQYIKEHPIPGNIRGLDHLLARLLVNSPKTNSGRPDFSNWRRLLFPRTRQASRIPKSEIRIEFDPSQPSYSGLRPLISEFENQVMRRLSERMMRTDDIAAALRISKASAHRILKRIGHSDRRKVAEEIHRRASSQRTLIYEN